MIRHIISQTTEFAAGTRLQLSEAQARCRRHVLQAAGDGVFVATAIVQFKAGEEIGLEGEPTKAQAEAVVAKDAPVKPARKAKG